MEPQSTRPDSATWEEDDRSNRRRPLTGKLAASPKALAFQQGKKVGVSTEAEHEINKTVASKTFLRKPLAAMRTVAPEGMRDEGLQPRAGVAFRKLSYRENSPSHSHTLVLQKRCDTSILQTHLGTLDWHRDGLTLQSFSYCMVQ